MPKILIIEDDTAFAQMLQKFLLKKEFQVSVSYSAKETKTRFKDFDFDLVLTDLRLPDYDGISLLKEIKAISPETSIIVMTGFADVSTAVKAMKMGASDYIAKPFPPEQIIRVIQNTLQNQKKKLQVVTEKKENPTVSFNGIKGNSEASQKLDKYIKLVAPTNISVLIIGESGTGKEVTARAIHNNSSRKHFEFVAVDCGAIPKELAASEFFGHVKGSFTGATEQKIGNFEAAHKGTLFLDEVGNLSYENQIQLLRALQERKIKRVGSTQEIKVDVRIITATNENLIKAVEHGAFREDLFHRLNEFSLQLPTLKERIDDLPLFANFFLEKANTRLNKAVHNFSAEVWNVFNEHHWSGNLRELQNVINRAVLLTSGNTVQLDTVSIDLDTKTKSIPENFSKAQFEKERIIRALKQTNYNKSKAAEILNVTRKTLYNRIKQYNLNL